MKKIFVIDTNVLLVDPRAIFSFEDNDIVLPIAVIEEIDAQKTRSNGVGYNARLTSRFLDELRKKGNLGEGIPLKQGGSLRTFIDDPEDVQILPRGLAQDTMDNRILAVALNLRKTSDKKVILVSRDINMRIKANAFGIEAQDYRADRVEFEALHTGSMEVQVPDNLVKKFYDQGYLEWEEIEPFMGGRKPYPNVFVNINTAGGSSALSRYYWQEKKLKSLFSENTHPWGIKPLNREQRYALELLLDSTVNIVTLVGKAGTGKTLLALAAGLHMVTEEAVFKRVLVARPVIPMGKELGFLPGGIKEKIDPWMRPIYDNLEFIVNGKSEGKGSIEYLLDRNLVEIEALTYIRGRSLPGQYFIVDEAQNLSKHEIKTIVTRAGKDTKIVFTGDPYQIDNPYLNEHTNGLTYLAQKFKEVDIAGHVTLQKGERSKLAELAAEIL